MREWADLLNTSLSDRTLAPSSSPRARVAALSDGSEPREAVRVDGAVAMRGEQRPTLGRENDLRVPSLDTEARPPRKQESAPPPFPRSRARPLFGGAQLRDRAACGLELKRHQPHTRPGAQLRGRVTHQREAVPPLCRARQRAAAAPARRPGRGASAGAAAVSRGRREGLSLVHVASSVAVHLIPAGR